MNKKVSVFWFRRDLRFTDNAGLWHALQQEKDVLLLFIFDTQITSELPADDARISFIYNQLEKLNIKLSAYGSSLLIKQGTPLQIWKELSESYSIHKVFYNCDYEPYAINRDKEVEDLLEAKKIEVQSFNDQVVFEPHEVLTDKEKPYTVFTPYRRKWLSALASKELKAYSEAEVQNTLKHVFPFPTLNSLGFNKSEIEVKDYNLSQLNNYGASRDYPVRNVGSYLGPHLRFGTIGIRELIAKLTSADDVFLSELIWREFFKQILYYYPLVVTENFYTKYNTVKWRNNEDDFKRWCEGKTGYPFVDAGMRELNATGYMHNRARMVTAGFLTKHLLIDWRWGEGYFAQKLLDYDLSANNGNWQWAAGTGCDAAPYFRVFNPETQLKKFDPELVYIKKWVPEFGGFSYPAPMVEHKTARERAIRVYREALATLST